MQQMAEDKPKTERLKQIRRVLLVGLGILTGTAILSFALLNQTEVTVDFFVADPFTIPVWLLVLFCTLIGWVIPRLMGIGQWFRWRRIRLRLQRRVENLEREVVGLRNIPLELEPEPPGGKRESAVRVQRVSVVDEPRRSSKPALLPALPIDTHSVEYESADDNRDED